MAAKERLQQCARLYLHRADISKRGQMALRYRRFNISSEIRLSSACRLNMHTGVEKCVRRKILSLVILFCDSSAGATGEKTLPLIFTRERSALGECPICNLIRDAQDS